MGLLLQVLRIQWISHHNIYTLSLNTHSDSRSAVWSSALLLHRAQRWLRSQRAGTSNLFLVLLCVHECAVDRHTIGAHRGCLETDVNSTGTRRHYRVTQVQEELSGDEQNWLWDCGTLTVGRAYIHFVLKRNKMRQKECLLFWGRTCLI